MKGEAVERICGDRLMDDTSKRSFNSGGWVCYIGGRLQCGKGPLYPFYREPRNIPSNKRGRETSLSLFLFHFTKGSLWPSIDTPFVLYVRQGVPILMLSFFFFLLSFTFTLLIFYIGFGGKSLHLGDDDDDSQNERRSWTFFYLYTYLFPFGGEKRRVSSSHPSVASLLHFFFFFKPSTSSASLDDL